MTHYSTKRVSAGPQQKDGQDGFAIHYADGYVSWCPKATFVRDYQPETACSFGHAIHALKNGFRVARAGWNGKGMWLELQTPDEHSKMSLPYIFMFTADAHRVPWLASQTDVLADDWQVL